MVERAGKSTFVRHYLKLLSVPLLLLVLSWSLRIVWEVFDLPEAEAMEAVARQWFDQYGLPALFASALIEGMLLVGGYFPGLFVIFLSIILTRTPLEAVVVVAVASAGLFLAHLLNYTLGRYGWYRLLVRFGLQNAIEGERENVAKRGTLAIFLSYWVPSAGALTDTAAGIMRMPFKAFFLVAFVSTIVWDTVIGIFVYFFRDTALSIVGGPGSSGWIFYLIIGVWVGVLLAIDFYQKRKNSNISKGIGSIP